MKKLFLLLVFCGLAVQSFAFTVGDLFIQNSRFWQNKVSLNILNSSAFSSGVSFDIAEHKDLKDKVYDFHLPFMFKFSMLNILLEPFWYPQNNQANAYGGNIKLEGIIRNDEINNIYASGYLRAAYANQKTNITRNIVFQNKENFKQWAFEGGLNFNFANLYNFNINGNIFTYPDEVNNITYFGGIMNQNEMADLGTIDYVLNLPHFSAGGGITWISPENNTKTFLSYKYINYEQNLIAHSLMLKTIIPISQNLLATLIYNHVFERHHTNKDLFGVGLNYLF